MKPTSANRRALYAPEVRARLRWIDWMIGVQIFIWTVFTVLFFLRADATQLGAKLVRGYQVPATMLRRALEISEDPDGDDGLSEAETVRSVPARAAARLVPR